MGAYYDSPNQQVVRADGSGAGVNQGGTPPAKSKAADTPVSDTPVSNEPGSPQG